MKNRVAIALVVALATGAVTAHLSSIDAPGAWVAYFGIICGIAGFTAFVLAIGPHMDPYYDED